MGVLRQLVLGNSSEDRFYVGSRGVFNSSNEATPYFRKKMLAKGLSLPMPNENREPRKAEVYGFIRAYLYLIWKHPACNFSEMKDYINQSQLWKTSFYANDAAIIYKLLESDFTLNQSVYERINRAVWSLGYGVDTARTMKNLVVNGLKAQTVKIPNIDENSFGDIYQTKESLLVRNILPLQAKNCLMVPPALIYKQVKHMKISLEYVKICWDAINKDLANRENFPTDLTNLASDQYEILKAGYELANITRDNDIFIKYTEAQELKNFGYCKKCNKALPLNKSKRILTAITPGFEAICTGHNFGNRSISYSKFYPATKNPEKDIYVKWSELNSLDSIDRFRSKTELDNENENTLLFDKYRGKKDSIDSTDPNLVKLEHIGLIDTNKVLKILNEMAYQTQPKDISLQKEYIQKLSYLLKSNYEDLINFDNNKLPIAAHKAEAESLTYRARAINEGTFIINGYNASILFFGVSEEKASRWKEFNSERLKRNLEQVDAAIIGAINGLVKI